LFGDLVRLRVRGDVLVRVVAVEVDEDLLLHAHVPVLDAVESPVVDAIAEACQCPATRDAFVGVEPQLRQLVLVAFQEEMQLKVTVDVGMGDPAGVGVRQRERVVAAVSIAGDVAEDDVGRPLHNSGEYLAVDLLAFGHRLWYGTGEVPVGFPPRPVCVRHYRLDS